MAGDCGSCGSCGACALDCGFVKVDLPACTDTCTKMLLDGSELCYFDSLLEEHIQITGTPIEYYHQDLAKSRRDPLYDEPIERAWKGPYRLKGFVEYIPSQSEMREEGFRVTWNGTVFLPRKALEDLGAPSPLQGDVLRFWENKFFQKHAAGGREEPGAGYYFDVIHVDDDQHLFDTALFLGFKLTVARRTEFSAERRVRGG